jgi:hypothetical protein
MNVHSYDIYDWKLLCEQAPEVEASNHESMINSAYSLHHSIVMEKEKVSKMSEFYSNLTQVVT